MNMGTINKDMVTLYNTAYCISFQFQCQLRRHIAYRRKEFSPEVMRLRYDPIVCLQLSCVFTMMADDYQPAKIDLT